MRGHVIRHCRPDVRREDYLKLTLSSTCENVTHDQIRQWHRFLNAHFCLIVEIHIDVRAKDQKMNHFKSLYDALRAENEEQDPHARERMSFARGERADRMQQTAAHTTTQRQIRCIWLSRMEHGCL